MYSSTWAGVTNFLGADFFTFFALGIISVFFYATGYGSFLAARLVDLVDLVVTFFSSTFGSYFLVSLFLGLLLLLEAAFLLFFGSLITSNSVLR